MNKCCYPETEATRPFLILWPRLQRGPCCELSAVLHMLHENWWFASYIQNPAVVYFCSVRWLQRRSSLTWQSRPHARQPRPWQRDILILVNLIFLVAFVIVLVSVHVLFFVSNCWSLPDLLKGLRNPMMHSLYQNDSNLISMNLGYYTMLLNW